MQNLATNEVGVMFWADRDHLARIKALGVRCGQLGIPGSMDLTAVAAQDWRSAMEQEQFTIVTVFAAYNGESYADAHAVERTVGFVPMASRAEREQRTFAVSDFAAALGVKSIACHVGFVPEDTNHPDYISVRELVRRVCDQAARHGQTFALETGQEPAGVLLKFLKDVERPNIGINFDPANMILYGTGDPIEALDVLGARVLSVHCKDGDWPPKDRPGMLGSERPLGKGAVGMERFVRAIKKVGFTGPLNVEREVENQEERMIDIAMGVELITRLTKETA
jgi:sugar phosphate isomerase/epimerase